MDYSFYVVYRIEDGKKLTKFLNENNIKYDESCDFINFNIAESSLFWPDIHRIVHNCNIVHYIDKMICTKAEMHDAEWFNVRSKWCFEYPQPEDRYVQNITYSNDKRCNNRDCGYGLEQVGNFRLKKSPKWRNRSFLMINWIPDELFVSDEAKDCLKKSGLRGFYFQDVLKKNGEEKIEDINQLRIRETQKPGLIISCQGIDSVLNCKKCGKEKYVESGKQLEFKKDAFREDVDIVKTYESFGGAYTATSLILINQKFYRFIVDNKMDKNLVIEPIKIVD